MPAQPAIAVCSPMRTLWPIWIWLSSFTPSPITVSSIAPRSIVVLAPISTSLPMRTLPTCGTFNHSPSIGREAEAVGADDDAGMQHAALADDDAVAQRDIRGQARVGADRSRRPARTQPGPIDRARTDLSRCAPMTACGPIDALGSIVALAIDDRARMPSRRRRRRRMQQRRDARVRRHRDSSRAAPCTGHSSASFGSSTTAPALVCCKIAAIARIGEERDGRRRPRSPASRRA